MMLSMWVIYDHPLDFPGGYIARKWNIGGGLKPLFATGSTVTGDTLEEVRAKLPRGLYRINRDPRDEPQVVECWL